MKSPITVVFIVVAISIVMFGVYAYDIVVNERTKVCTALGYIDYVWSQNGCLQQEGVMKIYVDYNFVLEGLNDDG